MVWYQRGYYKMHHVFACVGGAGVCVCVRVLVCHADISKTTTATDFLSIVLMNFHALESFVGFVDLGLKISK